MAVYELRTLKDGRWMTEIRSEDRENTLDEAKERVGSKQYQAVQVVEERYDEASQLHKEKVIFRHGSDNSQTGGGDQGGATGRAGDPYASGGIGGGGIGPDFDIPELEEPEEESLFSFFKKKKK